MGKSLREYVHDTYGDDYDKTVENKDDPRRGRGQSINWKKYYRKREEMWHRIWGDKKQ